MGAPLAEVCLRGVRDPCASILMKILTPPQALRLSVAAALATVAIKAIAWLLTDSVGFLSDALESSVNFASALFALYMVRLALEPADADHPFGHGKAEYFSALFGAGLICLAGLAIMGAAGQRLLHPQAVERLGSGTFFAVLATLVNLVVARLLLRSGETHRSPALQAEGKHLMADVWTTAGVILGVTLALLSGWHWLDPVVAIIVALHLLGEGWKLVRRSIDGLMDRALTRSEVAGIEAVLDSYQAAGVRFKNLRTRQAGAQRFASVALQVPGDWSVMHAHDVADEIERAVAAAVAEVELETHLEPHGAHDVQTRQHTAGPGRPGVSPVG